MMLTLFYRLMEAHIIPLQLLVSLVVSGVYDVVNPRGQLSFVLRASLGICSGCRLLGFLTMVAFFYRYRRYHQLCVDLQEEDQRLASQLNDTKCEYDRSRTKQCDIGWREAVVFPVSGVLFGAIPALQATLTHLFTARLRYTVSLKPMYAKVSGSLDGGLELGKPVD